MIKQSAFYVEHGLGKFIGIVAWQDESPIVIAKREWGTKAAYKELTAEELLSYTRPGIAVFTCSE